MSNCLNCGNELAHTEGKKEKKYCSDKCRISYFQKNKKKEPKYVLKSTYDAVCEENKALRVELAILSQNKPVEGNVRQTDDVSNLGRKKKPAVKIQDLTNQSKTNYSIDTAKHRLWQEGDPSEGTIAFARKYNDAWSYDELEKQLKNK